MIAALEALLSFSLIRTYFEKENERKRGKKRIISDFIRCEMNEPVKERENIFGFLFLLVQDNDLYKLDVRLVKEDGRLQGVLNPSAEVDY